MDKKIQENMKKKLCYKMNDLYLYTSVYAWHIASYRAWWWWIDVSRTVISEDTPCISHPADQPLTFSTYWNLNKYIKL